MSAIKQEQQALAALLDWYLAAGVDLVLDDAPHDRFAESAAAPPPRRDLDRPPAASPPAGASPVGASPAPFRERQPRASGALAAVLYPEEASRAAREAAAGAGGLEALAAALAAFEGCALKATAGHFLFSAGAPGAPLMILDFAPGEEEERSGAAFSGGAARLLDNMLKAIGRDRSSAYLAYATPWRPPGARELSPAEIAALDPFLRRHVALAAPRALLILGDQAARAALGGADVAPHRGEWFDYDCGAAPVRALVSPPLGAMRNAPALKRRAWRDLRALAQALG